MRFRDFRALVERLAAEVPPEYLKGVVDIEVSRRTVPHPVLRGIYTLGEWVPLELGEGPAPCKVVLYYGSFSALAREDPDFDWRQEAWETLTHELRHHLEAGAGSDRLERYDWAADENFLRAEGENFDPWFYLWGEQVAPGVFRVEEDFFWDRKCSQIPEAVTLQWQGRSYRVPVPQGPLPAYLVLRGLEPPPPGDAIVVLRRPASLADLWRRPARPRIQRVKAERLE